MGHNQQTKMKLILLVALTMAVVTMAAPAMRELEAAKLAPLSEKQYQSLFRSWMHQHEKRYASQEEFLRRFENFKMWMDFVRQHNADPKRTHDVTMNHFCDLTLKEIDILHKGYKHAPMNAPGVHMSDPDIQLPSTVDWRNQGVVTPVKNQGQCGSCWSFSTTGSMEGAWALAGNKLQSLSESQLVDCSGSFGNMGCNGGLMPQAFEYIISVKGEESEASYPYVPQDGSCKFDKSEIVASISSYRNVTSGSESELQNAVATVGPISVAINAQAAGFMTYTSGVYSSDSCPGAFNDLDHGVLAVGYGTQNGMDYWLVKNSWGADWGQEGYIMMRRNYQNMCGIATAASYPIV